MQALTNGLNLNYWILYSHFWKGSMPFPCNGILCLSVNLPSVLIYLVSLPIPCFKIYQIRSWRHVCIVARISSIWCNRLKCFLAEFDFSFGHRKLPTKPKIPLQENGMTAISKRQNEAAERKKDKKKERKTNYRNANIGKAGSCFEICRRSEYQSCDV